jgi:hypothetical protein
MLNIISAFNFRQTSLQNIITSRAFLTTITEKLNTEIITENNVVNEIAKIQYNFHIENMFYIAIVTSFLYGLIIYATYYQDEEKIEKLNNIELFSSLRRKINIVFIVMTIIFTKNIENAI